MVLSKEYETLKFVHDTNIEMFTKRLVDTHEQKERERLLELLAAEKERLRVLTGQNTQSY